jgi:hypothetical protein
MDILYPDISIIVEVCGITMLSTFVSLYWHYNVQSRDGGGNKMAVIIPVLDVKSRDGGAMEVEELYWEDEPLCRLQQ